jgi:hypothetical protein
MGSTGLSALLRGVLGAVGAVGFLVGIAVILLKEPIGGLWILVPSVVLILVALYEQGRYRAGAPGAPGSPGAAGNGSPPVSPPTGRYQRTDEVFDDPTTGRRVRVWFDPATGDRHYEPEP